MRRWAIIVSLLLVGLPLIFLLTIKFCPYPQEALQPEQATSLIIVDRHGQLLRQQALSSGGRAQWIRLNQAPPMMLQALIQSEDQNFYQHQGVDLGSLARATWQNLREKRWHYGASTITMQLARLLYPRPRTIWAKIVETVRALRLEQTLSKNEILEQYINRTYFGHGYVGVEAAARGYFGKAAANLSLSEALLLAVLPRAPLAYDPISHLEAALARRNFVINKLHQRNFIDAAQLKRLLESSPSINREKAETNPRVFLAPHFVDEVLSRLSQEQLKLGQTVQTTLDLPLQKMLEKSVADHVSALADSAVSQAAVVVLDSRTSEVLALVGSVDFFDRAHQGQINILTTPRHPGSTLKPFTYALALEQGNTPASITMDIEHIASSNYRLGPFFQPREHGPAQYREALAGSFNLAAVHVAERIGPGSLLNRLKAAGLNTLTKSSDDYGPGLTLGNAKVRLLDLAAASTFLVNGGKYHPATWIDKKIEAERQIFFPEVSWLVMDMLADSEARRRVFGYDLAVDLPYRVAVKTGTSAGYADNIALLLTSEYTVLAWAGNFDGRPMNKMLAMWGAAPLARAALLAAARGHELTLPNPPSRITKKEICALSGMLPHSFCPKRYEYFLEGTFPNRLCDWHEIEQGRLRINWPQEAQAWARRHQTYQ